MRTSLIPGMLEAAQRNLARQQTRLRLFEVGKVFLPRKEALLPQEKEMLVGLWTGSRSRAAWHTRNDGCDFYDIKGVVEGLARSLAIGPLAFTARPDDQCCFSRAGYTATIIHEGQTLGLVGELDPAVANRYNLKQAVFLFELDLEVLRQRVPAGKKMAPIPRFPSTSRDITVIVDQDVESRGLLDTVAQFGEALVEEVALFDVFAGHPIPKDRKSVSIRVVYRSPERTLEDETVNQIHHRLTQRLIDEFGAALPA